MINGIGFNLRRRQIVIRVDEDVEFFSLKH